MRPRKRAYAIERLERRDLFAAFAVPWPEIDSLRLSFVPDGTQVGDSRSELFSMLDSAMPDVDWQLEMLAAFQTWAVETNSNIGLVADQGQPVGTLGFKQGDLRFGDVRVGAFPMARDVLAVAHPYDPFIANTWVGDVFLNSDTSFLQDTKDQAKSLLSVMLHEAGHAFGIGHSTDTTSPMYPFFQKPNATLTPQDIATLRAIYGAREVDRWEGSSGNDSLANATKLALTDASGQNVAQELTADIGSNEDADTYALKIPKSATSLHVELQASGKSLLTSQLTVLNERGEVVASTVAVDPRRNDLKLMLDSVRSDETYFLQVRSAGQNVFGIGRYSLKVAPHAEPEAVEPAQSVMELLDLPTFANEEWMVTTPGYVEHTYYELAGTLNTQKSSQHFRFHSPIVDDSLTNIFTVILGAETGDISNLGVMVTDANGNSVPMTLISNNVGKLELQVSGVKSDVDYLATVFVRDTSKAAQVYELEIDFAHDGRQLQTIVSDSLDDTQPVYIQTLTISESGHYHFVVSGSDWSDPHETGVTMRIRDAAGQVVSTTNVVDGGSQKTDLILNKGQYTVEYSSPERLAGSSVLIQLAMELVTSPIGPQLRDMSSQPVERVAAPPVDALIAHWLPGQLAAENTGTAETRLAIRTGVSTESNALSARLGLRGFTWDADAIGQATPKADFGKPKKSQAKVPPLTEQTEGEGAKSGSVELSLPTVSSSPQSQAASRAEDEEPAVAPTQSPDASDRLGELDGIAVDTAIQLASITGPVVVQDQAVAAICEASETSQIGHSETETWMRTPNLWVVSTLVAGFAIATFVRDSTHETPTSSENRLRRSVHSRLKAMKSLQ